MHAIRDHGRVIFIDLRDHYGITQIVIDETIAEALWTRARSLRLESVICMTGMVRARAEKAVNTRYATGEIEVACQQLTVESLAQALPFAIAKQQTISEELRLKYRFLDLRRETMHRNILLRAKVISVIRQYMQELGFVEYRTPILTVSSRKVHVIIWCPAASIPAIFTPFRRRRSSISSLLCARGSTGTSRLPPVFATKMRVPIVRPVSFTELDVEMAFIEQEDLFQVFEALMIHLTAQVSSKRIAVAPFPRITYHEAYDRYGTDKPDIRFDLRLHDVTAYLRDSSIYSLCQPHGDGPLCEGHRSSRRRTTAALAL